MFVSLALLLLVAHFIAPLCCRVEEMLFHRPELAKSTAQAARSNQTIDWRLIAERFTAMPRTLARAQRGPNPACCCTDRGSSCVFTSQEHNFEEKKKAKSRISFPPERKGGPFFGSFPFLCTLAWPLKCCRRMNRRGCVFACIFHLFHYADQSFIFFCTRNIMKKNSSPREQL